MLNFSLVNRAEEPFLWMMPGLPERRLLDDFSKLSSDELAAVLVSRAQQAISFRESAGSTPDVPREQ